MNLSQKRGGITTFFWIIYNFVFFMEKQPAQGMPCLSLYDS